ncbi:MAG: rhomboid family intramembrane serine protease [Candidatus Pacearchaeota archaeon]
MNGNLRIYRTNELNQKRSSWFSKKYSITAWLIGINIFVFVLALILMAVFGQDKILPFIAIQPNAFFSGQIWTLITSMFMHGSFTHLFVNMVSLFFIGGFIEKLIGKKRYLWLYLISGIIAGLMFVFLAYFFGNSDLGVKIFGSPEIFAVGASGAIFALGGLLAVLTPKLRVYVFFIIPMRMWTAMIFLLGVLWIASIGAGLPFGNTAHLGGLLVGLGYGFYLRKKYPRKTQWLSNHFSS